VERLLVAVAIVVVAALVAAAVRRRRHNDAPTQARAALPAQLDRRDFPRAESPWLVVVFTSSTCSTCADVVEKAAVLATDEVAVADISYQDRPDLHARYGIEAVPSLVLADAEGVVKASLLGPVSAADLWAAVAAARD
jgi:thioredoxin-related protein